LSSAIINYTKRKTLGQEKLHEEKLQNKVDKIKKLAHALGVSDEELLGIQSIKSKEFRDQDMVFSLINSLAEKNKNKKKV
jgi:hypothetical protein